MITYSSEEKRLDYAPALLGNGEVALQLDFMGQQAFEVAELNTTESAPARSGSSNNIWWAGRRYVYDHRRFLIPFGQLLANVDGLSERPAEWTQTLDTQGAQIHSECHYEDGDQIGIDAFLHHDMNLLAIRKLVPQKPALFTNILRAFLPAAIMGAAVYGSYWLLTQLLGPDGSRVILCGAPVAVGVAVYCVAAVLCKAITAADCQLLPKGEKIAKFLHL